MIDLLKKYNEDRSLRIFIVTASFTPIFYNYFFKLLPSETRDFIQVIQILLICFTSFSLYFYYVGSKIKKLTYLHLYFYSFLFYLVFL